MIGKLKGILDTIGEDFVMINVNGVGYIAFCSSQTINQMPTLGNDVTLLIETHVREDHIHLYGFATTYEKNIFQQLTKVNGVGTKVALAILSALSPEKIITAIQAQDKAILTSAPGVGPKLAARLITELKDKLGDKLLSAQAFSTNTISLQKDSSSDAISALVNLGYNRSDAYVAITKASANSQEDLSVDELIRHGLKELAGSVR